MDSPTVFNRLGAQNPNWITYALERDVVHWNEGNPLDPNNGVPCTQTQCSAGKVMLRPDKRPRPLVVRSVADACLTVNFTNLLEPNVPPAPNQAQQGLDNTPPNTEVGGNDFPGLFNDDFVADRCAGFHAQGVELRNSIADDGSMVGLNEDVDTAGACGGSLVAPGESITYNLYTPHEGTFTVNSYGATIGGEQNSGNLGIGMFAQLNVQPPEARIYRSQMTEEELRLATVLADFVDNGDDGMFGTPDDNYSCTGGNVAKRVALDKPRCYTPLGQPVINYEARYPNAPPWSLEGKGNLPIVNMLDGNELVHSDINAIIVGPDADGTWTSRCPGNECPYPLESVGKNNPTLPNRLEPFREFASIWHDEQTNSQVFPNWYNDPVLGYTLAGVKDQFMINLGSGGIGSEIISNRLHTGPMHDCAGCAYEEFFLASQTVGDPGGLVNFPANTGIEACSPRNLATGPGDRNACWRTGAAGGFANGPIPGNYALYQEDPANIHHSYTGDFVKFRNVHVGAFEQHIFHFHNHQWLFNPNDDNANYLDAQEIMPGSGHTYELVNGGSGNRNKTAGDAIFHCHFYPHFAQGMWYHSRIQDVFESGSLLAVSTQEPGIGDDADGDGFHDTRWALRSGRPAPNARALPDAELPDGWPIPAILPLPGKPMPHMPAPVSVVAVDRGSWSLLGGRGGPDGIPESSQAVIDYDAIALGRDGIANTDDDGDMSPGFPFWLAGNECGVKASDVYNNLDANGLAVGSTCLKGTVGQRQPTPPLDMLTTAGAMAAGYDPKLAGGWDGGLPRHNLLGYAAGAGSKDTNNRLDFAKEVEMVEPVYFPETGTEMEKVSMAYHAVRNRPTYANNLNGVASGGVDFVHNGAPPVPGGPYNDPCIDDEGDRLLSGVTGDWFDGDGDPTTFNTKGGSPHGSNNPRTYKIANIQLDAVFNKVGYHYPQERIIALWEDVSPLIAKQRPPEPLVMRFNTFECGKLLHTNLVPKEYEVDDFQVRTPTDIIGQHIHLPKWDLTTNDGAANGWNYEDGTLSPEMVVERIHAISRFNGLVTLGAQCIDDPATAVPYPDPNPDKSKIYDCGDFDSDLLLADRAVLVALTLPGQLGPIELTDKLPVPTIASGDSGGTPAGLTQLAAVANPELLAVVGGNPQAAAGLYDGARTTIQRILVDPIVNVSGEDRGLGLTFSHDHYGPSTFQQIGLYSTILAEPAGSTWVHNESGEPLGTRDDGGPTTWQAAILTDETLTPYVEDHREFYFEMSDFQHAYEKGVFIGADADGVPTHTNIIQPNPFNVIDAYVEAGEPLIDSWKLTVNPPLKVPAVGVLDGAVDAGGPNVVKAEPKCPGFLDGDPTDPDPAAQGGARPASRPCAEAINISHSSMWVTNYRNEPVGLRVFDPNKEGPDGIPGSQADGAPGDLALALQSRRDRKISQLNTSFGDMPPGYRTPATYCQGNNGDGINCDRNPGDPITPIMRAYERDEVKIKAQMGATEEQHQITVFGLKWLSNGSGFGRSPNSGWRNFQSHGISEQFSLQVPVNPDPQQIGATVDYLYATDATRDGMWSGTWGLLRSYGQVRQDLFELPNNPQQGPLQVVNANEFIGVCPAEEVGRGNNRRTQIKNLREYSVTAVLANDILPNVLNVTIDPNVNPGGNVGAELDPAGGTLVYNRRQTVVPDAVVPGITATGGEGPLNDPTAILYVRTEDMVDPNNPKAGLKPDVPVEPLVLRANAGDCIEVTLRNRLPANTEVWDAGPDLEMGTDDDVLVSFTPGMPDLAGWQDMMWVVNRELFEPQDARGNEMTFFNNNLIRPSNHAGLHAQLVEYDVSRDDGLVVGGNVQGDVSPGGQKTYRWYAGDLRHDMAQGSNPGQRQLTIVATPIEFGGTNLLSADRVKQPQKGMFGALVIEPAGANWPDALADLDDVHDGQGTGAATRKTRAQVTVDAGALGDAGDRGTYREALAIGHKIANLRWADGKAIKNVNQEELGREGAEDSGHAGFNYGMEPPWFRFAVPPNIPFGNAGCDAAMGIQCYGEIPNAHEMYSNALVALEPNSLPDGDPATPVFTATAGQAARMHVLNGASADRDGTWMLHGHLWQRDPFVCPGEDDLGLIGRCNPSTDTVDSVALGVNPQGKWMASEEGMGHVFAHWPILLQSAGGTGKIPGDYLYRDYAPNGNRNGQFGILRVEPAAEAAAAGGGSGKGKKK